jgi:hypothetical protein
VDRLAGTLSNRDVGVLMWAGKYGLVNVVSSNVVKALVRPILDNGWETVPGAAA